MTTTKQPIRKFRVVGMTDEVPACDLCGTPLRKAVVLDALDPEGNVDERVHYGTSCAAMALGWTYPDGSATPRGKRDVTDLALKAQRKTDDEIYWARNVLTFWGRLEAWGATSREIAAEYFVRYPMHRTLRSARAEMTSMNTTAREILKRHGVTLAG